MCQLFTSGYPAGLMTNVSWPINFYSHPLKISLGNDLYWLRHQRVATFTNYVITQPTCSIPRPWPSTDYRATLLRSFLTAYSQMILHLISTKILNSISSIVKYSSSLLVHWAVSLDRSLGGGDGGGRWVRLQAGVLLGHGRGGQLDPRCVPRPRALIWLLNFVEIIGWS